MVVYKDEMACPNVRNWTKTKGLKLAYEGAKPLLYFLDKYATVMVGGARSMTNTASEFFCFASKFALLVRRNRKVFSDYCITKHL
jgi:hypothetical protein